MRPLSSWTLRPSPHSRVYARPLGFTELSFYYDSLLNGTSDTARHCELHAQQPDLFDETNVLRAWCSLKQYYPLLGAHIEMEADGKAGQFIVSEQDLHTCSPKEVLCLTYDSPRAINEFMTDVVQGRRHLDCQMLARVWILRRTDVDRFHVVLLVAHAITDGMSNIALTKRFLEELCTSEPTPTPCLEERLAMALCEEELDPSLRLSVARRRWLRALSEVIRSIRRAKLAGGHTLPQIQDPSDLKVPPKSLVVKLSVTEDISRNIILACRKHSLTFGHAYAVLAQIALTRVLCRLYIRGGISRQEWAERRMQPMHTGGPLNLRPYLDQAWLEGGGSATVGVAIGFFWYTLPFMPLGSASRLRVGDDMPSFDQLLSRDRFFLRSSLVKRQANHVLKHPLFVGIAKEQARDRINRVVEVTKNFQNTSTTASNALRFKPQFVLSFAGSSMGNVDLLEQYEYPSERAKPPKLRVAATDTYLRCRPGELYLGSLTTCKKLHMFVYFDGSTYDTNVVDEWLNEVKDAAIWYLNDEISGENPAKL